jgi:hypothetical protein
MDQGFNRPYLQPPQGDPQHYPNLTQHPQGNTTNRAQESPVASRWAPQHGYRDVNWAQNEFIAKTLEIETWKHNETRSELNMFRTHCFELENLLAFERAQAASMQNTIQDLRNRYHESTMERMAAETCIQELKHAQSLAAAYTRIEGGTEQVGMENTQYFDAPGSPLSSYKSDTFSPSLSPLSDLRMKRKSPPSNSCLGVKRAKTLSIPSNIDLTNDDLE